MKAIIFSAGLGTRFKPWTDKHPKALAVINGKSLLQRNIEYLQQYGIRDVIVNIHHFAEQIVAAVAENNGWGSHVVFSNETDELLDTGGGLLKAKKMFTPNEAFISCNADILTDLNIDNLLSFHQQRQSLISFGVTQRKTSRYFLFNQEDRLCGWRNKNTAQEIIPLPQQKLFEKAYSCVSIFKYEVFKHISRTGKFSLVDLYLDLAANHTIAGYDHSGDRWADVGKPETVAIAESLFP